MNNQIRFIRLVKQHIPSIIKLLTERQEYESRVFKHDDFDNHRIELVEKLETQFEKHELIGVGAFINDILIGYIFGEITNNSNQQKKIHVSYEGMAVKQNHSIEIVRQLYCKVATYWIENDCFEHSVIVPLGNKQYYEAFQHLSFAIEQVYAVLSVKEYEPLICDTSISVRGANHGDKETLKGMSHIILKTQNGSPTFANVSDELVTRITRGYESLVDGDDIILIACIEEHAVGFHVYEVVKSSLMYPNYSLCLDVAATCPNHMNQGIGKKLMNEGVVFASKRGFKFIQTDWKVTNLSASNYWPKCGFIPLAYRLSRKIDNDYFEYSFD